MVKKSVLSLVCASALFASDTELEQLKQQMMQLQQQLSEMQKHIQTLEAVPAVASNETLSDEEMLQKMATKGGTTVTSLLPDIALILNGGYTSRNVTNTQYANASIPGFGKMEIQNNAKDGFNLNYGEVAMSSTVDPYFDASAIFHIHGDGTMEVEEAYFVTRALDYGLRVKAGKFKSAFGRVNEKHHHAWNFEDQELVNNVFFGPDGLGGEGAQLQWAAPTPMYLMAGFELFNGNAKQGFSAKESASTAVGYLKSSVDVGNATVLAGLSYAQGKSEVQNTDGLGNLIVDSFTDYGQTRLYGVDVTLEYPLEGYGSLIWQNEWIQRNKDVETMTQKQAGYYSELMYKIDENWATGVRYDDLYKNMENISHHLNRTSVKVDYKPFEFSRFRLQYNQDHSKYIDDQAKTIHEVMLNYTLELGAHGAHAF
ncbi:MAG: hypothetical protein PHQ22_05995 [Sulfuricurvum sp.]|nr:hypothetical protein [Sulfuricurvum sp.]MDD5386727.1 hypothetical protein [Sulfuricurvum sp.]